MHTFAMTLDLKDDPQQIAEYEAYHRDVWPEVLAGLRQIGIVEMKIFRSGTRLFLYFEAPEGFTPERDYQRYAEDPRCREWDELMRRYQQQVPGASSTSWWTPMEEVFNLNSS